MASTDAKAVPVKNAAYRVTFPILDADGDLVTGATGLDSEVSIDAGTFADAASEATEIATSSGMYFLDLTAGEMNGDTIAIIVKTSSSGAKTTPLVLYTAARSLNDLAYPTVTGRSLDVTATGAGGIDWANVENPTTALNLSGTNIKTDQVVASVSGAVGSVGAAGITDATFANNVRPGHLVTTTIATLTDQTTFTLTAGSADNDAYNECDVIVVDAATAVQKATGVVLDYVGSTKGVILRSDPGIFTMAVGDAITIVAAPTVALVLSRLTVTRSTLLDNLNVPVNSRAAETTATAIKAKTDLLPSDPADASDIAAEFVTVNTKLDARLPAALVGGRMNADLGAIVTDTVAAANLGTSAGVLYVGQVSGATSTTTLIDSGLTQADVNHWKGRIIIFTDGGLKYQATDITAFAPSTDTLTFTAVTTAPTAGPGGTRYVIV